MNILRKIFGDRREGTEACKVERRGTPAKRLTAAQDRVDAAADDLCRTVSMKREDFEKMLRDK